MDFAWTLSAIQPHPSVFSVSPIALRDIAHAVWINCAEIITAKAGSRSAKALLNC